LTVVHTFPPPAEGGPYIAGRSAWTKWGHRTGSRYYEFIVLATMDGVLGATPEPEAVQVHHAIAGTQLTLNAYGYKHPTAGPLNCDGRLGPRTEWAVQWFQRRNNLVDDGALGPKTAKGMFIPLTVLSCGQMGVPAAHLLGMFELESAWDPGAVSTWYKPVNGPDRGLAQINKNSHPDISDAQAFDPLFAIPYAVQRLHNSPADALEWYRTGQPPDQQISDYVTGIIERGERILAAA
jgi:peptidoglycan hydrolase-like protein with peptidoglycan-binding domain